MKTHKKTGVTLALKSVIGLTSEKYWLPHFTAGSPDAGGDEFDRAQSLGERLEARLSPFPLPGGHSMIARAPRLDVPRRAQDGSWEGNDTLWRHDPRSQSRGDVCRLRRRVARGTTATLSDDRRWHRGRRSEGPLESRRPGSTEHINAVAPTLSSSTQKSCRLMGFDPDAIPGSARAARLPLLSRTVDGPPFTRRFVPPRSWPSLLTDSASRVSRATGQPSRQHPSVEPKAEGEQSIRRDRES